MTDRLIAFVQGFCGVRVLKSYVDLDFGEADAVILSGSNDRVSSHSSWGHFAHRHLRDLLRYLQSHSGARCGVLGICYVRVWMTWRRSRCRMWSTWQRSSTAGCTSPRKSSTPWGDAPEKRFSVAGSGKAPTSAGARRFTLRASCVE